MSIALESPPMRSVDRDQNLPPVVAERAGHPPRTKYEIWFGLAVGLGIVQDVVLGIPGLLWPNSTLSLLGQMTSPEPRWVSCASAVLLVLAVMYLPGALRPRRYPANAWLSVLCRPPGILFFFWLYPDRYPLFGFVDLFLTALQFPTLLLALYGPPSEWFRSAAHKRRPPTTLRSKSHGHDPKAQPPGDYRGISFQQLRDVIWSDRYDKLPYHFGAGPLRLITFFNHSARNLIDRRDLLPRFDKLIHANGICHTGVWRITEPSPYTGYFRQGSEGLVVARLSVAGLFLRREFRRAFGIGGKLFPTMNPHEVVWPANFVTVSHLSGTRAKHVLDIESTNRPTVGLGPAPFSVNRIIFRLMDTRPGFRQLYPISTLDVPKGDPVRTPDLMLLKALDSMPRIDESDFREELRVRHYPEKRLIYGIYVRNFGESAWNPLGTITFDDDVTSESGDKRLHFWIPRDVPDGGIDTA